MLLTSLNPAAVAAGADIADAVRIDGAVLSRNDLVGAATSVAERVGGARRVAVLATPTAATVLAVAGCLIAGVPVVPVPADVGLAERAHILADSAAQARRQASQEGAKGRHKGDEKEEGRVEPRGASYSITSTPVPLKRSALTSCKAALASASR